MSTASRFLRDTAQIIDIEARLAAVEDAVDPTLNNYDGYIFLHEFRQSGELDDNLALQRAKVAQLVSGQPIFLVPALGSGSTLDDSLDQLTNQPIASRYRAQDGDYLFDSWSQASDTGTGVTPVNPTTLPNPNDSGNMWSGMTLLGTRGKTRIRRSNSAKPFIFTCNPINTVGTTVNGKDEQSFVFTNIRLSGLSFISNVQSLGYAENNCQIQLNAVDNVVITNCDFNGFRGDAIQINNGHIFNGTQNRHNRNVIISDCLIDGVNQNNRHPILVTDVDGMLVRNVTALQCGKPGSTSVAQNNFNAATGTAAPGSFVVCQQNKLVTSSTMRDVIVRDNRVKTGGGMGVVLDLVSNISNTNPVQGIFVENNRFDAIKSGWSTSGSSYTGTEYYVRFNNNIVTNCRQPFSLVSLNGIDIENNDFSDCPTPGNVGVEQVVGSTYTGVSRLALINNTFRRCGGSNFGAFIIVGCTGRISYNVFEDCGGADFSWKGAGLTKDLNIDQNEIFNTSSSSPAMTLTMPVYDMSAQPTPNSGKPDIRGESVRVTYHQSNTLRPSGLFVNEARIGSFPKNTSAWPVGSIVRAPNNLPNGEIQYLRKVGTHVGFSNADKWVPTFWDSVPAWFVNSANYQNYSAGLPIGSSLGVKLGYTASYGATFVSSQNERAFYKNSRNLMESTNVYAKQIEAYCPSILSGGIILGFTGSNDSPQKWVTDGLNFEMVKFGVLFDYGKLRLIVGGALGAEISTSQIQAAIGNDRTSLGIVITLWYLLDTGECRVSLQNPNNGVTTIISSTLISVVNYTTLYPMITMANVNEFISVFPRSLA